MGFADKLAAVQHAPESAQDWHQQQQSYSNQQLQPSHLPYGFSSSGQPAQGQHHGGQYSQHQQAPHTQQPGQQFGNASMNGVHSQLLALNTTGPQSQPHAHDSYGQASRQGSSHQSLLSQQTSYAQQQAYGQNCSPHSQPPSQALYGQNHTQSYKIPSQSAAQAPYPHPQTYTQNPSTQSHLPAQGSRGQTPVQSHATSPQPLIHTSYPPQQTCSQNHTLPPPQGSSQYPSPNAASHHTVASPTPAGPVSTPSPSFQDYASPAPSTSSPHHGGSQQGWQGQNQTAPYDPYRQDASYSSQGYTDNGYLDPGTSTSHSSNSDGPVYIQTKHGWARYGPPDGPNAS